MATNCETSFRLTLGSQSGCVMTPDNHFTVETVAEARAIILQHAMDELGIDSLEDHTRDSEESESLRLNLGADGPTWEDLAECEEWRRYDPAHPDAGMTCNYLLYSQGGLEGVGGLMWTYGVCIWATAPPEVWDHPADQPAGLDDDEGRP